MYAWSRHCDAPLNSVCCNSSGRLHQPELCWRLNPPQSVHQRPQRLRLSPSYGLMQGLPYLLELEGIVALEVKEYCAGVGRHLLQPST